MSTKISQSGISVKNSATKIEETFKSLLTQGVPLYRARGLGKKNVNSLYAVAHNLYDKKEYQEALEVFNGVVFYDHFDKRGWIGSALCCQILHRYEEAIFFYSFASSIDIQDPLPIFRSVECYLALKRYSEACSALEEVSLLSEGKPEFAKIKNLVATMKENLKRNEIK